MRRGEIWTVSGGASYTGKPRPAVILQDNSFDATASITLCAFTSDPTDAPLFRLVIEPTETNGLRAASRLMIDKISTIRRSRLGRAIGSVDSRTMVRVKRAVALFVGLV